MRRTIALILICGAPLAALLIGYIVRAEERALYNFVQDYQTYHHSQDVDAIVGLFYWEGVERNHQTQLRRALTEETRFPIRGISVRPSTPEDTVTHFGHTGMRPNLEPHYYIAIELDTDDALGHSLLIGRTPDGALRAAGAVE